MAKNIGASRNGHAGNSLNSANSANSAVFRTGIVLPKQHPSDPNVYYVNFGEKTASSTGRLEGGVWCNNGVSSYTRFRDANNQPVSYGSYTPIQPYTPVNVLMSGGGVGIPTIIGFASTNTSVPDNANVNKLHVIGQTPMGSVIEMDDSIGAIRMMYNKGESTLSLGSDIASMEVTDGESSGKQANTGIFLRRGAIVFRLPHSQLQFDETGLTVSFDDSGTAMKITKKGASFEGMEHFKVNSSEQVSIKGSKLNLEGTKDASLTASELKLGGKQLTNITGTQINMESMIGISLKSTAINLFAWSKIQEFAALKDSTILGADVRTAAVITDTAASYNITSGVYSKASGVIAMDGMILSNMGMGTAVAPPTYAASKATMVAVHAQLTLWGTLMLFKVAPLTALNKILADTLAGASEPAQEPSGNASGARDKNDKKSFGSVAASKFMKNNSLMEKFSVVPPLLAASAAGITSSNSYSASTGQSPSGSSNYAASSIGYLATSFGASGTTSSTSRGSNISNLLS